MIVGNLSLGQMVAQLMEVVSGLGLTNKTVEYYKAAFDDIVAFADQVGGQRWSNSMLSINSDEVCIGWAFEKTEGPQGSQRHEGVRSVGNPPNRAELAGSWRPVRP